MKLVGPFHMKQFSVAHDSCAMRVNTDGCLLGAIAGENHHHDSVQQILDIGTGSGVIALQMAQRFNNAFVDAVEIHGPSAKQATENFKGSPWNNRMICYHEPLQDFEASVSYDIIVSNPPYFESGPTKLDEGVANARHALTLDFNSLIQHASRLLKETGTFWCVLPADRADQMIEAGIEENLHPISIYAIRPKSGRAANRVILAFSKESTAETTRKEFVLYKATQEYTDEVREVLEPFYSSL